MATPNLGTAPWRQPRWQGWRPRLLLAVAVILLAGLALAWGALRGRAELGTAYGARVACSCRYVAGRALHDCRRDFEPGMGLVMLSEDAATKTVTARVPLLARDSATFHDGWGCQLERWRG